MRSCCSQFGKEELAALYLRKLEIRFKQKIEYEDYYLSFSGGKDSYLLYWFIKEYLKTNQITVVAVNTRIEHKEIMQRMYQYSDTVLLPNRFPHEVMQTYGSPCFTKNQDEYIRRYQSGSRSKHMMSRILGETNSKYNLSEKARKACLDKNTHKISNACCVKTKEATLAEYERRTGKKAIIAVRKAESINRDSAYQTCMAKTGKFSPLYDFPEEAIEAIYQVHKLEIPKLYQFTKRSGCVACPYINDKKRIETDLQLATPNQRKYIISLFRESYNIKGVNYQQFLNESEKQMSLLDFIKYDEMV